MSPLMSPSYSRVVSPHLYPHMGAGEIPPTSKRFREKPDICTANIPKDMRIFNFSQLIFILGLGINNMLYLLPSFHLHILFSLGTNSKGDVASRTESQKTQ